MFRKAEEIRGIVTELYVKHVGKGADDVTVPQRIKFYIKFQL